MDNGFFVPPVTFLILLAVVIFLSRLFSKWAFRKTDASKESKKAYSCGEEFSGHLIQPDYSQFFPFAFFFTILHVVTLMVATVPTATPGSLAITVIYLLGALIGLLILFRR